MSLRGNRMLYHWLYGLTVLSFCAQQVHGTANIFYCKCHYNSITQIKAIDDDSLCTCGNLFPNTTQVELKACMCEYEDGNSLLIQIIVIGFLVLSAVLAIILAVRPFYQAQYQRETTQLSSSGIQATVNRTRLQRVLDSLLLE